jgi:hypothetical protein
VGDCLYCWTSKQGWVDFIATSATAFKAANSLLKNIGCELARVIF